MFFNVSATFSHFMLNTGLSCDFAKAKCLYGSLTLVFFIPQLAIKTQINFHLPIDKFFNGPQWYPTTVREFLIKHTNNTCNTFAITIAIKFNCFGMHCFQTHRNHLCFNNGFHCKLILIFKDFKNSVA